MNLAHHAGAPAASVWDTPWPWAGLTLIFFAVLALVAEWMLQPPQYRGRHAAPDWWVDTVEAEPQGRHVQGWPAREVRQIVEHTGEWAIADLIEAMFDREIERDRELVAGGVR